MESNTHNTSSVPGRVNDPQTLARFASIKSYDDYVKDKNNPVVMVTLTLGDQPFLNKNHFETFLTQHTNAHDEFTIVVSDTAIDDFYGQVMKNSKNLLGEKITIHFHQKGNIVQSFKGIIANICNKKNEGGGYGNLYISGFAPSILLDSGKECQSYENKTLKEIVAQATEEYKEVTINTDGLLNTKYQIPYVVQYKESDYQFIQRLARRYGEFFYYNGTQLMFNNETQKTVTLLEGGDLINVEFELMIKPQNFSYISYDVETGNTEQKTTQEVHLQDKINPFQYAAIKASEKVFTKKPTIPYNAISEQFRGDYLKDVVRREKESREQLMQVRGKSRNPHLRIGGFIKLKDINDKPMESYRIIDIKHHQSGYDYENEFIAIPDVYIAYYYDEQALPRAEQQVARVTDNNDPEGWGRVRVQFIWQEKHQTKTPWIRVVQPHAGGGKGFYFIPEIGEEVWVDFEDQNAERPFVVGSNYNGAAKSGYKPTTKAIHTKSGTKILLNDEDGSIKIEDAVGNSLIFDGNQKITLSSSIFEINTQQMLIRATDKLHITTNNYVLNVLSQLYIFTAWMKQQVSGFMQVFSNAALIKSNNALDIEAKHAKLSGKERAILDSKKEAVVNSLGVAQLQGKQGNEYSNNGQGIAQAPLEKIGLAVVYFRPLEDWRGEFGFDWLRELDNNKATFKDSTNMAFIDENYYTILESGYGDGQHTDLRANEAYEKLKRQYLRHPINKEGMTNMNEDEYYVPYLTLFPKSYVDTINPTPAVSPMYQATLRMLGEITEDIDRLEFKYDETLFELDKKVLSNKSKIEGLEFLQDTITITCKEELDSDKEIRLYAYPKRPAVTSYTDKKGTRPSADLDQLVHRRLAGKIIVVKNDATVRKEEKFVLVKVETNILNQEISAKGGFDDDEKMSFYNTLHQALIIPKVEEYGGENSEVYLNLSADRRFRRGGKYVEGDKLKTKFYTNQQRQIVKSEFLKYVQEAFFNDPPENRVRYAGYFTVFAFGVGNPDTGGETAAEFELLNRVVIASAIKFFKNVALYAGRGNNAFCHEALHGLGLYHTHREEKNTINGREVDTEPIIKDSKKKYVYKHKTTTNVMSYNQPRNYTTWRWQWSIINPNISEK